MLWANSVWIPLSSALHSLRVFRTNPDSFIFVLASQELKEGGEEKMDWKWYHWVSRWVVTGTRFNGESNGGCSLPRVSGSDPHWLQHTDRKKQASSGFSPGSALNIKRTPGGMRLDPRGAWIKMKWNSRKHWGNICLTLDSKNTTRKRALNTSLLQMQD